MNITIGLGRAMYAVDTMFETTELLTQTAVVPLQGTGLLQYAIVFFVLAILAAAVGARGVAGVTMAIAKWFVIIFLVLAVVSIVFG